MNNVIYMVFVFAGGVLLGILFFGGLWFTVRKAVTSKTPALVVLGSYIFRVGITVAGFYFIGMGNWKNLVICLIGFIIARFVVIYYTKSIEVNSLHAIKGANHET